MCTHPLVGPWLWLSWVGASLCPTPDSRSLGSAWFSCVGARSLFCHRPFHFPRALERRLPFAPAHLSGAGRSPRFFFTEASLPVGPEDQTPSLRFLELSLRTRLEVD